MIRRDDPQAVRELAYSLWEQRGKPEGDAERHWFEAERLLGAKPRTDNQRVDESVRESFPASDAPASGLPDKPPANADRKWAAADAAKSRKGRGQRSRTTDGEPESNGTRKSETPKVGSRDAPGG
jgi:DUF2934 family protein